MIKWIFMVVGFAFGFLLCVIINSLALNRDTKGTLYIDGSDMDNPRFRFVFDEDPDTWINNRVIIFFVKHASIKDISQN